MFIYRCETFAGGDGAAAGDVAVDVDDAAAGLFAKFHQRHKTKHLFRQCDCCSCCYEATIAATKMWTTMSMTM